MTALRNDIGEEKAAAQGERQDPARASWSTAEMLLAAVVDQLARANWMFLAANSRKKGAAGKPPEPIRRPGATGRKPQRGALTDEQRRRLDPRLRPGQVRGADNQLRLVQGDDA